MKTSHLSGAFLGIAFGVLYSSAIGAQPTGRPQPASGWTTVPAEYRHSWDDYMAQKAKARPAKPPNWRGIWRRSASFATFMGFGDLEQPSSALPPGYAASSAKLTPKYKAAYQQKLENIKKGIEWDRLSDCLPAGMPRWLTEPWLREFVVTPEVTWLIHEQISEVRRVYTDGRGHTMPGTTGPLWMGESIGFWDGDNLVIHTAYLKAGEYQRGQPDFSFKASVVERWRPMDADTLKVDVTVYDPESLQEPYQGVFTYAKVNDPGLWVNFSSCEQGNNAVRTAEGSTSFVLPGEPGYRDPDTLGIPEVALDSLPQ